MMKDLLYGIKRYVKFLLFSIVYKHRKTLEYPYTEKEFVSIVNNPDRILPGFPKIIWIYWEGDEVPALVEMCVKRIKSLNTDFQVHLLYPDTLYDYVPDLKITTKDILVASKSDIIRLALLYKYGGIWLDATIILNEDLGWVLPIVESNRYDCIAFFREIGTNNMNFPVIENWFLCCPPQSPFIKSWLDELAPLGQIGAVSYFEALQKRADFKNILHNMSRPEYFLAYLAQQIVMQEKSDFNVCLLSAEKTAFFYQAAYTWNFRNVYIELMFKKKNKILPPLVKLTYGDRAEIDFCRQRGLINKDSIIGSVLNN